MTMTKNKEVSPEYVKSKTVVWWDIDRCPIPDGFDACWVGRVIDTAVMNSGYSGPVTIFAIGNLEDTPDEVLRALSSTGILMKAHAFGIPSILCDLNRWDDMNNQSPATIMLISDSVCVEALSRPLCRLQKKGKHNIILACPHTLPKLPSRLVTSAEWLWDWNTLLKEAMDSENKQERLLLPEKFSEDLFICKSCSCTFAGQSFEMFIAHLKGIEHALTSVKNVNVKKEEWVAARAAECFFRERMLKYKEMVEAGVEHSLPQNATNTRCSKKRSRRSSSC